MSTSAIDFRPFDGADVEAMPLQEAQRALMGDAIEAAPYGRNGYAWTAWHPYGYPLASCGIVNGWAWALLSGDLRRHMVPITRKVRQVLQQHLETDGPVYTEIDMTRLEAVRWAKALGMRPAGFRRTLLSDREVWIFDDHQL